VKKKNKIELSHRAVMGLFRKSHFESGGDLTAWRGRCDVYLDKKKQSDKKKCRKKVLF
jgi:hypothetical protein